MRQSQQARRGAFGVGVSDHDIAKHFARIEFFEEPAARERSYSRPAAVAVLPLQEGADRLLQAFPRQSLTRARFHFQDRQQGLSGAVANGPGLFHG